MDERHKIEAVAPNTRTACLISLAVMSVAATVAFACSVFRIQHTVFNMSFAAFVLILCVHLRQGSKIRAVHGVRIDIIVLLNTLLCGFAAAMLFFALYELLPFLDAQRGVATSEHTGGRAPSLSHILAIVSALILATAVYWNGLRLKLTGYSLCQYLIYSWAISYALIPHAGSQSLQALVISWATFFIIDDWLLLEHYVIRGKSPFHWRHAVTVLVFNAIILGSAVSSVWTTREVRHLFVGDRREYLFELPITVDRVLDTCFFGALFVAAAIMLFLLWRRGAHEGNKV